RSAGQRDQPHLQDLTRSNFFLKIGSVEIILFNVLGGFATVTAVTPLAISIKNQFIMDLW
ncbi:MAG: hypothetical protein NTW33_08810, partial [Methanoregula sp.]|nr:hypothetical protein [Methanoregula sp.]